MTDAAVAVITGASRGLGAGCATAFRAAGFQLGLLSRSRCPLAGSDGVLARQGDVADEDAVAAFAAAVVSAYGSIDVWVNNAAELGPVQSLANLRATDLRQHLETNLIGSFNGIREFARHVRSRPGPGLLISITTTAAHKAYAGWAAYCAGKAAVERLVECAQLEGAEHGLKTVLIVPGVIDTGMQSRILESDPEVFPDHARFCRRIEAGGLNSVAHVAQHILGIAQDREAQRDGGTVVIPDETVQ